MDVDYSKGRYIVFGANGQPIGRIDGDEFVRSGIKLLFRIDGSEVYEVGGRLLGFIDGGVAKTPDGAKLFTIRSE